MECENTWKDCDSAEMFEIVNINCPECGNRLVYQCKEDKIGRLMFREFCDECHHMSMLQQAKNAKKRTNSSLLKWADNVKHLGNGTCRICGRNANTESHHLISVSVSDKMIGTKYMQMKYELNNGICVCNICHSLIHGNIEKAIEIIREEGTNERN